MVIKTVKKLSKYEEFFAFEAKGDSSKVKKKSFDDTVTDYTDDLPDEEVNNDDEEIDDTVTDYTDDIEEVEDTESEDSGDENVDDFDLGDGTDYTEDDSINDDSEPASQDESNDVDTSDEGTDYTADVKSDDINADTSEDDTTNDNSAEDDSNDTAIQKYNLYREFMRLYLSYKKYISKLENIVKDNVEGNIVITVVTNKLRELRDLIYEYLTIKFHSTEYSEALLFFHTCIETTEILFKMIKNNEIFIKH